MKRVYLVGSMGSGKTYWGRLLAQHTKLPFIDMDECIVEKEGRSIADIFEQSGEDYFRQLEAETLRSAQLNQDAVISSGGGTPCFFGNMEYMRHHGLVVWLQPTTAIISERIWKSKHKRPLIAKAQSIKEVSDIIDHIVEKRKSWYAQAHITLTSNSIDLPELLQQIESFTIN